MNQTKTKTTNLPQGKRYNSIPDMVRDLSEDKEYAESLARSLSERNIIDMLMALRASQALSQKDIADKVGCTQSRVSKLESGKDDSLRMGDFHAYADALGLEMMIFLCKKDRTMVEDVKYHAFAIRRVLLQMAKVAGQDATIAEGVRGFFRESAFNLGRIIREATKTISSAASALLSPMPLPATPLIQVASGRTETENRHAQSSMKGDEDVDDDMPGADHVICARHVRDE